ncbi:MAG: Maf family protein [Chloroflexi bacterium]|nr:Maf family protein [Chloroflexota bacterium]
MILASSSPRRRELLKLLGVDYVAIRPDVDEAPRPGESSLETQHRVTLEKARTPQAGHDEIVIAADTTVLLDGEMLNKPAGEAEAWAMLRKLRGRTHEVQSCIVIKRGEHELMEIVSSLVTMRNYSDQEIADYIATGDPFDKAGSYAVQHPKFQPVQDIQGCPLNVVGLPLCRLRAHLPDLPDTSPVCMAYWGRPCLEALTKDGTSNTKTSDF